MKFQALMLGMLISLVTVAAQAKYQAVVTIQGQSGNKKINLSGRTDVIDLKMGESFNLHFLALNVRVPNSDGNQRSQGSFLIEGNTNSFNGVDNLSLGNGRVVNEYSWSEFGLNLSGMAAHPDWFGLKPTVQYRLVNPNTNSVELTGKLVFSIQANDKYARSKNAVNAIMRATRGFDIGSGDTQHVQGLIDNVYTNVSTGLHVAAADLADHVAQQNSQYTPKEQAGKLYRELLGRQGDDEYLYRNDYGYRALADKIRRFWQNPLLRIDAYKDAVVQIATSEEFISRLGL